MRILHLLLILSLSTLLFGQNKGLIYDSAIHFQLEQENDSIDFIVVDTVLDSKKPVLLFCQGSMPIPLFIRIKKDYLFKFGGGISNFDQENIKKHYHLVVISMPKTPLYSEISHLNQSLCYIPDTSKKEDFRIDYLKADYIENYIGRANAVLEYLQKQAWVDNSKLVVFGHSQGSLIGTSLAHSNQNITHLGVSAYNSNGRMDQMIRQERASVNKGFQSWEQANQNIDYWEDFWKNANDPEIVKSQPQLIAWKSFSKPTINLFTALDIPLYLVYGTEDITSDLCDLIPMKFIEKGKSNLSLKRKVGLDHNYFEVDKDGRAMHEKAHWPEVMNDFIEWTLSSN